MARTRLDSQSSWQGFIKILVVGIVVGVLLAYPFFGTLTVFTKMPPLVASIPVRSSVLLMSILLLVIKHRGSFSMGAKLLWMFWLLYLARLIWDYFIADIRGADLALIYFIFTCMIPAAALLRVSISKKDEHTMSVWLFCFGIATSVVSILANNLTEITGERSMSELIGENRLFFDAVNPVTYGHVAVTCMIAAISLYRPNRKYWKILLLVAGVVLASILLYLSGSRGPIIALATCLVVLVISQRRYRKLLLILVPVLTLVVMNIDLSGILERFTNIGADDSSLERVAGQLRAIEQFNDNPIFGSAFVELVSETYPHNPIIEAAMSTGIFGLLLFVGLLLLCYWRIFILLSNGYVLLPLIALQYQIAAMFSGALFLSNSMWVGFALVFSAFNNSAFNPSVIKSKLIPN